MDARRKCKCEHDDASAQKAMNFIFHFHIPISKHPYRDSHQFIASMNNLRMRLRKAPKSRSSLTRSTSRSSASRSTLGRV